MKTNRRDFFKTAGAGAAAVGIAAALPASAAAQAAPAKAAPVKDAASKFAAPKAENTFPVHFGANRKKQMWPIKSQLKSVRIKHDAAIDPISWAYMKELRENNETRKIYPINPYVEVYTLRHNLYGLFTHNLDGGGDVWMFLTVGPEKALLIDNAYGLGDIKGLCDQLTGGKPLYAVVTHEHFDHAYGSCRFDKVYCHEFLAPYLALQNEHIWDYLFDEYGDNIWVDFDRKDLPKFKKYEIAGMKDGYTFNLGGDYEIELIYQGGHSPGHAAYLDKKNRIVFTGDNIICDTCGCGSINAPRPGPHMENTSLQAYRDNLKKLAARVDEYDHVFPSHFMIDVENSVVQNQLDCVESIIADPESYDYVMTSYGKDSKPTSRYAKHIKGFSVVFYGYNKA